MDSSTLNENNCVICLGEFSSNTEDPTTVTRGIPSLIEFSNKRGDTALEIHLSKQNETTPPGKVLVHASCRRSYVDPKRTKRTSSTDHHSTPKKKTLRSTQGVFQWETNCFFCDKKVSFDRDHPDRHPESRRVGGKEDSVKLIDRVRKRCDERGDDFGSTVRKRLSICTDLVADEAVYHSKCHATFFLNNRKDAGRAKGRPERPEVLAAFNQMCDWLENASELHTIEDLQKKMEEYSGEDVYSLKRIKQKLEDRYKEVIFFSEVCGRKNIVCFKNMASWIVSDQWYSDRRTNPKDEATRIIETAAKLIKSDLRDTLRKSNDTFPSTTDASKIGWIPQSLRNFLSLLINSELKVESIGQCIAKATLPRSIIPPILFSLAVELDHIFGSKWLNTQLFTLGFAESYDEVNRFKQTVVMSEDIGDILQSNTTEESFTTFVGDNVDHNIATLDGKGTFHGMGVIAVTTNKGTFVEKEPLRTRPKIYVKANELVRKKGIPITSYDFPVQQGLHTIIFDSYRNLMSRFANPVSITIDKLWHSAGLFTTATKPRPNWNGFMQDVSVGQHPSKSKTVMLPIIDLNPSDETCIYSTLLFAIEQSKKLNVITPSITFDQPLWLKALEIITAKGLNIVPLLGGFHMLMSFYGSMGTIMSGSGIERVFQNVYGENAVKHMLAGKAVARATRAHILTESALVIILQQIALAQDADNTVDLTEIQDLYDSVVSKTDTPVTGNPSLENLNSLVEKNKTDLREQSRTARLWLQYIDYVEICRVFIRAARTGDWELHLLSTSRMLNLFAATGHIHYAKSARIYLQLMVNLENKHPWLYRRFAVDGLFVVRRSERFWAGLWPDLSIEQIMMKALKSRGGLTRGSGFTASVRTLWVYSMHACASYHNALSSLTHVQHKTSDQHEELGLSRRLRDFHDLQKLITWFEYQSHNPFDSTRQHLQALDSGLIANDTVNCDAAEFIGKSIQDHLDGVSLGEASVKRSEQAVTLISLKPSIKVGGQKVVIDPMILFSRLIVLLQRRDDISSCFAYELAPVPMALFKDNMMRKPAKSSLAVALDKILEKQAAVAEVNPDTDIDCDSDLDEDMDEHNEEMNLLEVDEDEEITASDCVVIPNAPINSKKYVIDGGYLLHRVVWDKVSTYKDIILKYRDYVRSRYGSSTIAFDGYQAGPSTKDHEHTRRLLKSTIAPDVSIELENTFSAVSQKAFLSNSHNKQEFIDLLALHLEADGHTIVKSTGDADTMIVSAVLDCARTGTEVQLVAADTDLLIMLLYFWNSSMGQIIMRCEGTKKRKATERNIGEMAACIGDVRKYLTFAHAFGGCDTTSAVFGQGKLSILKLLQRRRASREDADVFLQEGSTSEAIAQAGINIFVMLYGGKSSDTLPALRYLKYMKMASSSKTIKPENLPPSERAAIFHVYRVYHQVQEWNTLMENVLNPEDWGWKSEHGFLIPMMTDEDPAPEELLNIIRCSCSATTKNPCGGMQCSCRSNGLKCVAVCGNCRGTECQNCKTAELLAENNEEVEGEFNENIFDV